MQYLSLVNHEVEVALEQRNLLLAAERFSRPTTEALMAIVVSYAMNRCLASPDEIAVLQDEGKAILDNCRAEGKNVVDVFEPTREDIDAILQDTTITDLCIIGEGALGCLYVLGEPNNPRSADGYDWEDVSKAADHLKTGNIYQRMCSITSPMSPIAWGTFAAADITKIWVSDEPLFDPKVLHDRPETELVKLYTDGFLDINVLRNIQIAMTEKRHNLLEMQKS